MSLGVYLVGAMALSGLNLDFPPRSQWPSYLGHKPDLLMKIGKGTDAPILWFYSIKGDMNGSILKLDAQLIDQGYFPNWRRSIDFSKHSTTISCSSGTYTFTRDQRVGRARFPKHLQPQKGWFTVLYSAEKINDASRCR